MKSLKKIPAFIILFAILLSVFTVGLTVNGAEEAAKANPSGSYLKYTVDVDKKDTQANPNLAFNFMTLKKTDYIIQEGDIFEYDVYSYIDEKGWGAIDGDITGVGVIRDAGLSDTDGTSVHTGQDLSFYVFEQWYHRVIPLGVTEEENSDKYTVGRKLNQIQIAMHPENEENGYQGIVLYDNIVITNNGEVKLVIFKDESDFVSADVREANVQGTKATLEMLVFTPEEEQAFKDAEEAKIKEQESREASKAEAEASRQASIEQASIDASIAEAEAANSTAPIEEPTSDNSSGSSESSIPLIAIIGIAAGGIVVLIVIIILIAGANKKKGGKQ